MALQDFIQKLKEQDDSDVVYSKEREHSIQIIPPKKANQSITLEQPKEQLKPSMRIIPPSNDEDDKPKTIKFKLNVINSSTVVETEVKNIPQSSETLTTTLQKPKLEQPKIEQQKVEQQTQTIQQPKTQQKQQPKLSEEEIVEELFIQSGTSMTKRAIWFEYYEKAKSSRKKNSIVDRMKEGKFAITIDNQVLILPDHDIRNKSSSQLLGEKWLHNYET